MPDCKLTHDEALNGQEDLRPEDIYMHDGVNTAISTVKDL
jgi:hypothetical protein